MTSPGLQTSLGTGAIVVHTVVNREVIISKGLSHTLILSVVTAAVFCSPSPALDSALVILKPQPCHGISLTSQTSALPGKESEALPDLAL